MPSPAPSRFTLRTALLRFRGNRRGSAAVEFALVAPVFFALLFAIIETALMFFASQVLETVAQNSARVVLTGQAQSGSVASCAVNSVSTPCTQATFKTYVCSQIPALFDCNSLVVDVESYSSFSAISLANFNACNFDSTNMGYNPGTSGQPVVVRLYYKWPLFVTGLGYNLACSASNNTRLLVATAAFQNEPY
ncbi:pilus assembly protein [Bradyrhizobium sp. INPA01-394B]|uniref:Pilus assembly protein n=1 Tax=Bradyrhizobium campsiandrae TaxID=1729892 RepID=A0ABR7UKF2_9BRAD|nr:TadE/TadG family type IV pilus assembly protein [Bradyrhizobium campsiandrae]MBC9879280.1 pilus assembly protein [Bradyrhizobium campsiandrae]MBC9984171.1 pilus assembly protein [Bradyrhizobium campsiandrae]